MRNITEDFNGLLRERAVNLGMPHHHDSCPEREAMKEKYEEYISQLLELPEAKKIAFELDGIVNHMEVTIKESLYKKGFDDGLNMVKSILGIRIETEELQNGKHSRSF